MRKIAVYVSFMNDRYRAQLRTAASEQGFDLDFYDCSRDSAALLDRIGDYEIIYGHPDPAWLKRADRLRWLCSDFAGVEKYLDEAIWPSQGCLLSNSSGAYGPAIREREAASNALLGLPELSYLAVNIYGTRAEIIVREVEKAPELLEEDVPADIVAAADGIIEDIQTDAGRAMFQDGDVVAKGETLISGVLDLKEPEGGTVDLGSLVVHAAGNVTARTWRTLEETIPLTSRVKEYTGEENRSWGLKILWFDLDFFENSSISGGRYDKITETAELTLFGRPMPAALTTVTRRGYTLREEPVDGEQAAKELEELLRFRLEELMAARKGEVLRTDFVTRQEDGRLTVTLLAECREEIGRTVEREGEVGRIYGTPQEDTKETG